MGWFGFDFNNDGEVSFTEHILSEDILGESSCSKRRTDTDDTDRELDHLFLRDDLDERDDPDCDLCVETDRDLCYDSEDFCSDFDCW